MPPEWPPAVACGQPVVPRGVYYSSARFSVVKERVDALSFRCVNARTTQIQLLCLLCGLPYSSERSRYRWMLVPLWEGELLSYFHDDPRTPYGGVLWVHVAPVDVVFFSGASVVLGQIC